MTLISRTKNQLSFNLSQKDEHELEATVLLENNSPENLICAHGLSVFIKYHKINFLLDFGPSDAFLKNAENLNIDITKVKYAILSHAHYDHADGMKFFLDKNKVAPIFISASCQEDCWSRDGDARHYIGIQQGTLSKFNTRFIRINKITEISNGVYIIPHSTNGIAKIGKVAKLYQKVNSNFIPDDFSHEQSLVFKTENGLIIFNSCSHSGAEIIIQEVKAAFPNEKIFCFIGGLHLSKYDDNFIKQYAEKIKKYNIPHILTCHCTGDNAFNILHKIIGDNVSSIITGDKILI